jgi:hypothetical protein
LLDVYSLKKTLIHSIEAAWTADPLERYSSFSNISSASHPSIPSSLAPEALAKWSTVSANLSTSSTAQFHVSFPHVQWSILRLGYGWSSTQWQAWTRGTFIVPQSNVSTSDGKTRLRLWASNVIEVVVDGRRQWGGDFYALNSTPLILELTPNVEHIIEARIVRDVRSMGGVEEDPATDVSIQAEIVQSDVPLEIRAHSGILPDLVEGIAPSGRLGGVSITNIGSQWLEIIDVRCADVSNTTVIVLH